MTDRTLVCCSLISLDFANFVFNCSTIAWSVSFHRSVLCFFTCHWMSFLVISKMGLPGLSNSNRNAGFGCLYLNRDHSAFCPISLRLRGSQTEKDSQVTPQPHIWLIWYFSEKRCAFINLLFTWRSLLSEEKPYKQIIILLLSDGNGRFS